MQQLATTDGPGFGALTPRTLDEALKFADILAKSTIVPKDYQGNPGNVLVAVQWGLEIGLQPLQAMQNIAVINGRPSLWGDALLALVRGSGLLEYINEEIGETEAVCTVKRRGEQPVTRSFSMDDAQKAGLKGKSGPWTQYPKRMMQMRARAFALRDVFTDVLRGMHIAEESQDEPEMKDVTPRADAATTQSKTAAVKDKIAAGKSGSPRVAEKPAPTLGDVLGQIERARTEEQLRSTAGEGAKFLSTQADKDKVRIAYSAKLKLLRDGSRPEGTAGDAPQPNGGDLLDPAEAKPRRQAESPPAPVKEPEKSPEPDQRAAPAADLCNAEKAHEDPESDWEAICIADPVAKTILHDAIDLGADASRDAHADLIERLKAERPAVAAALDKAMAAYGG